MLFTVGRRYDGGPPKSRGRMRRGLSTGLASLLLLATPAQAAFACVAPEDTKIEFCHATGSESNPYNLISTNVRAFLNAGHIDHSKDIWSAFDYLGPKGERIDVAAQGDQSILRNGCEAPKPPRPDPKPVSQTEEGCELKAYGFTGKSGVVKREGEQEYVWSDSEWVLEADSGIAWGKWKLVKEYSDDEYFKNCAGDNPGPKFSEWSAWTKFTPTCDALTGVETRTRTKTTYKWDAKDRKWIVDTVTIDKDQRQVSMSDEDFAAKCKPDQPLPKAHSDDKASCDLNEVGGTAVRTGTEAYVWDLSGRKWVLSGKIDWQDWQFTPYTNQEYFEKCAGQPEPEKVAKTHGDWTGQPTCDNPSIYQTREWTIVTTKQEWNFELRAYVWGDPVTTHKTETAMEATTLTKEQIKACHPKDAPKVTYTGQTCAVGDQGKANYTGGSLSITADGWNVKVFDKDGKEVTDLTNLNPGDYTIVGTLKNPDASSPGNIDGWKANEDGSISKVVTITAAEDCSVPKPAPKVEHFSVPSQDCNGHYVTTWDMVSRPYWDGGWKFAAPVKENLLGPTFVGALTNDEWWLAGCYSTQPADEVTALLDSKKNCSGVWEQTTETFVTYSWRWSGIDLDLTQPVDAARRGMWAANPAVTTTSDWVKVASLTAAEKEAKGCPELAYTGGGGSGALGLGLSLLASGVAIVALRRKMA